MFRLSRRQKIKLMNFYPPYVGAGIRIRDISPDFMRAEIEMKLRWWNKNLVGTHFGGSLMSMSDPFYMLLLVQNLGREYIVWDKASTIKFRKPGTGKVTCVFEISHEFVDQIKSDVAKSGKKDYVLPLVITNEKGEIICELEKTIYVRRK